MKIDWAEKPDGIDMTELRDFMKRAIANDDIQLTGLQNIIFYEQRRIKCMQHPRIEEIRAIEQKVEVDCKSYISALLKLGYIEVRPEITDDVYYMQTISGTAFAMASPKRFTRKAAQKQLDEFLRRCNELNNQAPNLDVPETICQVDSVILFGSFAKDALSDVGDVDLCLNISVRDQDLYNKYNSKSFIQYGVAETLNRNPIFLARKKLRKGLNILSIGSQLPEGSKGVTLFERVES